MTNYELQIILTTFLALLNLSMNHAIASSLRVLRARSATEPYLR
ncbi:hypothetical protein [Nostoc sp. JL31]|nr:hypothetical protein [Nostoc sp. JL31]